MPELARFAEELGFHGLMVGDHLLWPAEIETPYPYSPDGKIFVPPDTPWPDPWVLFAHLGAVTRKLHFASNIYLAALRDPLTVAKSVSTAAALTQDRIVLGVSAGWLKEEYEQVGIDFETRAASAWTRPSRVVRKLLTGQVVRHEGPLFSLRGHHVPGTGEAGADLVRRRCRSCHAPRGAERRLAAAADDARADAHRARGDPHHAPGCRPCAVRILASACRWRSR